MRRRFAAPAVLALAVASLVAALQPGYAARSGRAAMAPRKLIPSYDARAGFTQGDLWSPDMDYIASARVGEGSVLDLAVIDARSHRTLARLDDVRGFVWVPNRPHRLVVAACGMYGKAFLGIWDGGSSWRSLHRVRDPEYECFRLYGVTADGTSIVYGLDPDTRARGPREAVLKRRHWLRLPAR